MSTELRKCQDFSSSWRNYVGYESIRWVKFDFDGNRTTGNRTVVESSLRKKLRTKVQKVISFWPVLYFLDAFRYIRVCL
ncbi:hypothetical protein Y032_0001g96 [Ancylostoma ceylanicum]|nr:hypothetical protein Y032_0001g96 [Ancylostoma ceylanicum]